jgi:hypothetical protein
MGKRTTIVSFDWLIVCPIQSNREVVMNKSADTSSSNYKYTTRTNVATGDQFNLSIVFHLSLDSIAAFEE